MLLFPKKIVYFLAKAQMNVFHFTSEFNLKFRSSRMFLKWILKVFWSHFRQFPFSDFPAWSKASKLKLPAEQREKNKIYQKTRIFGCWLYVLLLLRQQPRKTPNFISSWILLKCLWKFSSHPSRSKKKHKQFA